MKKLHWLLLILILAVLAYSCKKEKKEPTSPSSNEYGYDDNTLSKPKGALPSDDLSVLDTIIFVEDLDLTKLPPLHKGTSGDPYIIPGLPTPKKQKFGDCTAWAVGYGMLSIAFGRHLDGMPIDNRIFSPPFIWNQLYKNDDKGIHIIDALNLVKQKGCCEWAYMKGEGSSYLQQPPFNRPTAEAFSNAENYKIFNINPFKTYNVDHIKHFLSSDYPIPFAMWCDEGMENPQLQQQYNAYDKLSDGRLVLRRDASGKKADDNELHAMLLIGYDDDISAFLVMNSWGNTWEEDGLFWIDYDYLGKKLDKTRQQTPVMYWCHYKSLPSQSVTYVGEVQQGPWKSFYIPFSTPFTGDIRITNLKVTFTSHNDINHSMPYGYFSSGIEIKNFPPDATIDKNEPEEAIKVGCVGNSIEMQFPSSKFTGTFYGDKIEGIFERKIVINETNGNNSKDVFVPTPLTLHKQ